MQTKQYDLARDRVHVAGMALIVLGGLGFVLSMLPGLLLITDEFAGVRSQASTIEDTAERFGYYLGLVIFFGVLFLPGWLLSGGWVLAGWQMRRLRWRGFAVLMSALAIIPCYHNLCVAGPILGIWLLVVLLDVDTMRLFDPGAYSARPPVEPSPGGNEQYDSTQDKSERSRFSENPYESNGSDRDRFY